MIFSNSQALSPNIKRNTDLYGFIFELTQFLYQRGWELDLKIYNDFMSFGSLHDYFLLNMPGIKHEMKRLNHSFMALYNEICNLIKPFEHDQTDKEGALSG